MRSSQHQFEAQGSTQTLAQGLAEYFAANPALKRQESLSSAAAREFFRSHDIVHVLYGCSTTLPDEAIVKLASLFGTTGRWSVLRGYASHEALDIYTKLPFASMALALLVAPYLIARTVGRCWRQPKRWPWAENEHLIDEPLFRLRAEYGITVARARRAA